MTRSAYHQWVQAVGQIIGMTTVVQSHDLELMWRAGITPVETAAAIAIGLFEEESNR